jgi:hypothetical protein
MTEKTRQTDKARPKRRGKSQFHFLLPCDIKEQLVLKAKEEGVSISELAVKALTMYLTKDIMDESLVLASLSDNKRKIDYVDKKLELLAKLHYSWYQWFFLYSPELPDNEKERKLKMASGNKRTVSFIKNFRANLKHMPSFLESLLGDIKEKPVERVRKQTDV